MKGFLENTWKHRAHVVMCLPAILVLLFFSYVPMAGLVLAFKKFDYKLGIWGSPFNGLDNFKFLLASKNAFFNMTTNTIKYYLIFTIVGTFLNVVLAIAIDQLVFKKAGKNNAEYYDYSCFYILCSSSVYCLCVLKYRRWYD